MSHISYAPLFKGTNFSTKMLESNILYDNFLIDIYMFNEIEKISESLMQIILLRQRQFYKTHVQPERLYFLFAFCARHYPW